MTLDKKRVPLLAFALALIALPAAADKVYVDYDHEVDFAVFETFTYAPAERGLRIQDDHMDETVVADIVEKLTAAGMTQVESGADIVVTYQVSGHAGSRLDVTGVVPVGSMWGSGWGWAPGFGPGWGYSGGTWYTATTMISNYKVGVLVVAGFDTSSKNGIWRGSAELTIDQDQGKTYKKLHHALDKMAEKWHKMHKGD